MAYQLGYCSLRWQNPDLEPALEALMEAGWDGWECRFSLNWLGTPARVRRLCQDTGMPLKILVANGTPTDHGRENVEINKRRIDFAAEIEVDCFMYMTGRRPEGTVTKDDLKAAAEGAEIWADYASQYGLELSYHIHSNSIVDSLEEWRTYVSMLDKAKLCIDVSHAEYWGYDPVESIREFKDQLNYIHLQDWTGPTRFDDGLDKRAWCPVGEGNACDFSAILSVLKEINYDRWVTGVPGTPIPGHDSALIMAQESKSMYKYMRGVGY